MFGYPTNVIMNPGSFDLNLGEANEEQAEPQDETEIKLSCHTIMIGTYAYKPQSKVRITSEGVSIPAPRLCTPVPEDVILHIPLKSFVHVLALTEHTPVILLFTEVKTGERVRSAIGMRRDAGPYFDPLSSSERCKRIALLPSTLGRRAAAALRTLFGMVLDDLPRRDPRAAAALAAAHSVEPEPKPAAEPPAPQADEEHPARGSESPPQQDDASSSSSVIFPPNSPPISLSSHSSPQSPKSSPNRKRKGRHKKNKSNKKMKYVLVKTPAPNDVDAFLAGVAPILKGLSPLFLNLAKYEIISAALKYEKKMLTENCNGVSQ